LARVLAEGDSASNRRDQVLFDAASILHPMERGSLVREHMRRAFGDLSPGARTARSMRRTNVVPPKLPWQWSKGMKTIIYTFALAFLATIAACSQSNEQQGTQSSNRGTQSAQCSPYDPQCRISQAPGLNNLLPADSSIQQMRQIPMTQ
jgi:hypothetical protein